MQLDFEVERRGNYFVCRSLGMNRELAPVFDTHICAAEIVRKVNKWERFFQNIPHVPYLTPYPRPADVHISHAYPLKEAPGTA